MVRIVLAVVPATSVVGTFRLYNNQRDPQPLHRTVSPKKEQALKFRNSILIFLLVACCGVSHARQTHSLTDSRLERIVRQSRIQPISPRATPPAWMDYDRVRLGFEFLKAHDEFIQQILGTSSLAATFAAKDIAPVLMQTGRLPKDFSQRLKETGRFMNAIMQPHDSREEFLTNNLAQAYQLGLLHAGVARQMKGVLHWNRKERAPLNQQAYALVLYSFAWWPVEALEATRQIDAGSASRELDGWFHLWSVIGYEMGVSEALLPTSYTKARETVALLRKAQYAGAGEAVPEGIPTLLGGQVHWLVAAASAQSAPDKPTPEQLLPGVAAKFAQVIQLSPGLSEALGLGSDPAAQLIRYASLPAQN